MPRPPDQPYVVEDADENAARERTTIRELVEEAIAAGEDPYVEVAHEPLDTDAVIARLGPERWEELRRRRDRLLALLRRRED